MMQVVTTNSFEAGYKWEEFLMIQAGLPGEPEAGQVRSLRHEKASSVHCTPRQASVRPCSRDTGRPDQGIEGRLGRVPDD